MKKQLLFFALCISSFLSAQSIEFTSAELTSAEVGSTVTVNYKYTSAVAVQIYTAINKYDDITWSAKITDGFLASSSAGTDITGSFDLVIPANTELTADLTGAFNYKIVIEMKTEDGVTWLAGAYPTTEIDLVASTNTNTASITITSAIPTAEVDSNITVNYTYTSTEADSYIYIGLNLYDASGDYNSFIVGGDTGVVNGPGTDITGSISFTIPASTTLTADLTTDFTYELSVEMKEKVGWTVIADDYPKQETVLVASGTLNTTSFTEELNKIKVYPNPVLESLNIQNLNNLNISTIKISNILGKTLQAKILSDNKSIDVSNLNSGIYILTIQSENKSKNIKFIKQ